MDKRSRVSGDILVGEDAPSGGKPVVGGQVLVRKHASSRIQSPNDLGWGFGVERKVFVGKDASSLGQNHVSRKILVGEDTSSRNQGTVCREVFIGEDASSHRYDLVCRQVLIREHDGASFLCVRGQVLVGKDDSASLLGIRRGVLVGEHTPSSGQSAICGKVLVGEDTPSRSQRAVRRKVLVGEDDGAGFLGVCREVFVCEDTTPYARENALVSR